MIRSSKTKAIILSSKVFFEKDKLIEFFSPDFGKQSALVKGALGKNKTNTGVFECSNIVTLILSPGRNFNYINQASIVKAFPNIRNHFNSISLCQYFFSIIKQGTVFNQQSETLFHLLESAIELLNAAENIDAVKEWFQHQFLNHEGLLCEKKQHLSDQEFSKILFEYTGKLITQPILI